MLIFGQNVPLISLIFLKRSLVFPILLFPSSFMHCSLKETLSLHAFLWNTEFGWIYLSLLLFLFASFLSPAICKSSSDNHFLFLCDGFVSCLLYNITDIQYYRPLPIVLQAYCSVQFSSFQSLSRVQLSYPYMTTGKTIALTRWTLLAK